MQPQPTPMHKTLHQLLNRITLASQQCAKPTPVRLVAVSKTKSVEQIMQAYEAGVRHFGENYVDEIEDKAPKLPEDIKWHFIGHLQSNKIKRVLVGGLDVLETVDRESLAEKLQKHLQKTQKDRKLKIFIQVKTSQQQSKNGAEQPQIEPLYQYITKNCPNLTFKGLMTIGKEGDTSAFRQLREIKERMCAKYEIPFEEFQLSMGMSGDFQQAVREGSTNVRIGSLIFGARVYPKKE